MRSGKGDSVCDVDEQKGNPVNIIDEHCQPGCILFLHINIMTVDALRLLYTQSCENRNNTSPQNRLCSEPSWTCPKSINHFLSVAAR